MRTISITGAVDFDWEDITEDASSVYIADIGNNRQLRSPSSNPLVIHKINKADLLTNNSVSTEQIFLSYEDENPAGAGVDDPWYTHTEYDAESLFAYDGFLYIFTKNYKENTTRIYKTSTIPGTYVLPLQSTYSFPFLVTGAEANEATNTIALVGYDSVAVSETYLYIIYDFIGDDFTAGTIHPITINDPPSGFRQIEGVAFKDNTSLYISSEEFDQQYLGSAPSGIFTIDIAN